MRSSQNILTVYNNSIKYIFNNRKINNIIQLFNDHFFRFYRSSGCSFEYKLQTEYEIIIKKYNKIVYIKYNIQTIDDPPQNTMITDY